MVEKINGTWKMISSEGFDDYMKALGKFPIQNLVVIESNLDPVLTQVNKSKLECYFQELTL